MSKTFLVIPARNEERWIKSIVAEAARYVHYVVIVDDGSSDRTAERAQEAAANVIVLKHGTNLGKGQALRTGCEAAIKKGADYIVLMDGDGQHQPQQIPEFVAKLRNGCDIVFGFRQLTGSMPIILRYGNRFLTWCVNSFFGMQLKDSRCGFEAFTVQAYYKIKWGTAGYTALTEIIVNSRRHSLRYGEVPISTIYHDSYKGTTFVDGLRVFWDILLRRIYYE